MEITLHIHLTNWLYNAGGEKNDLWDSRKNCKKSIPHYQLHLSCESIVHLPNKALSPLSYHGHSV